jgi:NADH:ubiquinone oxidoreductase subunit 5 (subunit L)/multisubunit Na+/H+ antiporter MnhA subunit
MLQLNLVFISFLQFIIIFLFGRFLGERGCAFFSLFCSFIFFFFNLLLLTKFVLCGEVTYIFSSVWIISYVYEIYFQFLFDGVSLLMLFLVSIVSGIVQIYSFDYVQNDALKLKFISYLSIFTFFMVLLISSGNLLILFIGWEGVGLASFLLISF